MRVALMTLSVAFITASRTENGTDGDAMIEALRVWVRYENGKIGRYDRGIDHSVAAALSPIGASPI